MNRLKCIVFAVGVRWRASMLLLMYRFAIAAQDGPLSIDEAVNRALQEDPCDHFCAAIPHVSNHAVVERVGGRLNQESDLIPAILESAALRVRPIAMSVAVIIAGLLPIMRGSGTGSEVMPRIDSPMIGSMITTPLLSMFVVPVAYMLLRSAATRQPLQPRPSGADMRAIWRTEPQGVWSRCGGRQTPTPGRWGTLAIIGIAS